MKIEDIFIEIRKDKIYLSTKEYMPLVYSAEGKFRKGILIDYCYKCKSLNTISMWHGARKYCSECTDKLIVHSSQNKSEVQNE